MTFIEQEKEARAYNKAFLHGREVGLRDGKAIAIDRALEIIKDYDLYKSDEDGDLVACKWEVWAEIKALKEGEE